MLNEKSLQIIKKLMSMGPCGPQSVHDEMSRSFVIIHPRIYIYTYIDWSVCKHKSYDKIKFISSFRISQGRFRYYIQIK